MAGLMHKRDGKQFMQPPKLAKGQARDVLAPVPTNAAPQPAAGAGKKDVKTSNPQPSTQPGQGNTKAVQSQPTLVAMTTAANHEQQAASKKQVFKDGDEACRFIKALAMGFGGLADPDDDDERQGKGRRRGRKGQKQEEEMTLQEKLHKSWDGKSYLERIEGMNQTEAEEVEEGPVYMPLDFSKAPGCAIQEDTASESLSPSLSCLSSPASNILAGHRGNYKETLPTYQEQADQGTHLASPDDAHVSEAPEEPEPAPAPAGRKGRPSRATTSKQQPAIRAAPVHEPEPRPVSGNKRVTAAATVTVTAVDNLDKAPASAPRRQGPLLPPSATPGASHARAHEAPPPPPSTTAAANRAGRSRAPAVQAAAPPPPPARTPAAPAPVRARRQARGSKAEGAAPAAVDGVGVGVGEQPGGAATAVPVKVAWQGPNSISRPAVSQHVESVELEEGELAPQEDITKPSKNSRKQSQKQKQGDKQTATSKTTGAAAPVSDPASGVTVHATTTTIGLTVIEEVEAGAAGDEPVDGAQPDNDIGHENNGKDQDKSARRMQKLKRQLEDEKEDHKATKKRLLEVERLLEAEKVKYESEVLSHENTRERLKQANDARLKVVEMVSYPW